MEEKTIADWEKEKSNTSIVKFPHEFINIIVCFFQREKHRDFFFFQMLKCQFNRIECQYVQKVHVLINVKNQGI